MVMVIPPTTWTGTWCPQCGPDVPCDEDGCCSACGSDAVGDGAEQALAALSRRGISDLGRRPQILAGRLAEARAARDRGGAIWLDGAEAVQLLEMAECWRRLADEEE